MKKGKIQVLLIIITIIVLSESWTSSCIGMLHKVKRGETLSGIAKKYDVPMKSIAQTNSITSYDHLKIGEKLLIPVGTKPINGENNSDGVWHTVKHGDSLYNIARKYNIQNWKQLQRINGIDNPKRLKINQKIYIPNEEIIGFANPLKIKLYVTSKYGYRHHPIKRRYMMHDGIDFRAATGTRVYASKTGRVSTAKWKSGYGRIIVIQHADDFSTAYAHLSRISVSVGDIVKQGQVIGLTGNSGLSTGPHLHFEIRYKDKSENPARHLDIP